MRDTAKSIEYMVIDALLEAEPHLKIAKLVENPKRYVHLTDNLLNTIEASTDKVSLSRMPLTHPSPCAHRNSNPPAPSSSASAPASSTKSSTTKSFRTKTRT